MSRIHIKKYTALILLFCLCIGMMPPKAVYAASADEAVEKEGVLEENIEIGSVEDLLDFAQKCHVDSWSKDKNVRLLTDLDLTGADYGMIPVFAGSFDGCGHTISGFNYVGDGYVSGFFRYIENGGIVKNLTLKGNIESENGKECIGSICGINYGTVKNCKFIGMVSGRDTVGGIAGINEEGATVSSCSVRGRITGYYSTGGVVGINHGTVSYCTNNAGINDDSAWVEEDDEMGGLDLIGALTANEDHELYSGVDTGGIAGFSDGVITGCTNFGTVGYEHTGYNIGGIAGRQSGIVSMSNNNGTVYGRKDVGGIVGQMEPFIEVDEAESLRNAINKLHGLIDKTIDDMQAAKDVVRDGINTMQSNAGNAIDTGDVLVNSLTEFVNDNLEQADAAAGRIEHVSGMIPDVLGQISTAGDYLSTVNGYIKKLSGDMDIMGKLDKDYPYGSDVSGGDLSDIADIDSEKQKLDALKEAYNESVQNISKASDDMQNMLDALKNANSGVKEIVNYINEQPNMKIVKLDDGFDGKRRDFSSSLKEFSDSVSALSNNASDYSDVVNEDLKAVNNQLNVVFNLLADHIVSIEDLSIEELYEDVDDENIDSITTGRADVCTNKGVVKGDINVGGIAGSMSIDDEDPEDSAAGTVKYEIGRRFISKCLVTDCINEGYITAKKDGAGGICGYMNHGIIVGSQGYGSVESTEGGYVGGICGESLTIIKGCYALCFVSGGTNVGGIAGFAETLKDCYSMASVNAKNGKWGAIAGQIASYGEIEGEDGTEPKVIGNYYVGDDVYGIDNISYVGVAEPISYRELLAVEQLPAQFWHLKVIYKIDGVYLGSEEVEYGNLLDNLNFPKIPEKDGFYGVWPDVSDHKMKGTLVLEAEYKDNVTIVHSSGGEDMYDVDEPFAKPYALAEGTFTEDTVLKAEISDFTLPAEADGKKSTVYEVSLENSGRIDEDSFAVRILNPYDDVLVYRYVDGVWMQIESKVRGQYLQVDMPGTHAYFCVISKKSVVRPIVCVVAAAVFIIIAVSIKKHK